MEKTTAIKLIIRHEIKEESSKKRDMDSTGKPLFGDKSNAVAAAFRLFGR